MNTQISIDVNGDPRACFGVRVSHFRCQLGSIVGDTNPTIDHHLLFANICIQPKVC